MGYGAYGGRREGWSEGEEGEEREDRVVEEGSEEEDKGIRGRKQEIEGKKTREMLEGTVSNLFKETFDGSKWIGIDFQTTALST